MARSHTTRRTHTRERRRASRFARRDFEALGSLLDGAVNLVRQWTADSAGARHPIFPDPPAADLHRALDQPLPARGRSARRLLAEMQQTLLPSLRDNGHPRFFGYVMSPPSAVGIAGDLIASALDQNLTSWRSAPGATEVERVVVDWLRQIAGLPRGATGLLTSGGSLATFTALAVARTAKAPRGTARGGLGRLGERLMTLYVSDQGHMSVPRAAELLGLGTAAVRILPTDGRFRMDPTALERAVDADRRAGHLPFCVVASAGTAATGAIDPLARIARIARKRGLWLHVDAAYGGPLGLSPAHHSLVGGLSEAHSVSLDPHKWLYAPLDAGCVLFRDGSAPRAAFSTQGDYAQVFETGERESFAFFDHGPELSRRFRALKVWLILKYHGAERIGRRIDEEMELARHLANRLEKQDETELMAPVETSIVCFRYVPPAMRLRAAMPEAVLEQLNHHLLIEIQKAGKVYLSNARLQGRFALRACIVNFRTTRAHVEAAVKEILAQGRRVSHAMGLTPAPPAAGASRSD
ncbi:MAG: pyridoxal phosphate-dependent decarboxylase family protein [Acidobacteriota bacterium]